MIRQQLTDEPLFYTSEEIAKPASGNFYVRLNKAVGDWQRLSAPLKNAFSGGLGRPTDPVVYLKIYLIAYLENIIYDTDLAERISDSIAIRKFLGYSLSEKTPDHSSISRNRELIARHCRIEEVLSLVVGLCQRKGLVDGEVTAVDSSLIPANASLSSLRSLRTGKKVSEHLRDIEEHNKEAGESKSEKKKPTVSNEEFRSNTDPDARIGKKPGQPRDMYYKATHTTDGKGGIIVAAGVSHADQGEVAAAIPVLQEASETLRRYGIGIEKVTADAGYGSADFHAYIEGLKAIPVTNWRADNTKKPEGFKKESFTYDKDSDSYKCPVGEVLSYESFCISTGLALYRSSAKKCVGCVHRGKCIDGKGNVRTVSRHPNEASRERNIARCHTNEGRSILSRRKAIVESPFGHMKTYGGMGIINCRGMEKANVKLVIAAAAYDLIKLVGAITRVELALVLYLGSFQPLRTDIEMLYSLFCALRPNQLNADCLSTRLELLSA